MAPINNTWDGKEQVSDSQMHHHVWFYAKSYKTMLDGLQGLLEKMKPFIDTYRQIGNENSDFIKEIERIRQIIKIGHEQLKGINGEWADVTQDLSQKSTRYLKAGILFTQLQLEEKIDELKANHGNIPDSAFKDFYQQIHELETLSESGIFQNTKPADIFLDILLPPKSNETNPQTPVQNVPIGVLDNVMPIMDEELRERCLPLLDFANANSNKRNQYDSVIREAATILENRVKLRSCLSDEIGDILVGKAFNKENPILRISTLENAQNGVLLLFKGYTSFIRNDVAHNLVPLTKERTIQLLGFIDYLLSLVEGAEKVR